MVAGSCMKMVVVVFAHVDSGDEWVLWWLVVGGCVALMSLPNFSLCNFANLMFNA